MPVVDKGSRDIRATRGKNGKMKSGAKGHRSNKSTINDVVIGGLCCILISLTAASMLLEMRQVSCKLIIRNKM